RVGCSRLVRDRDRWRGFTSALTSALGPDCVKTLMLDLHAELPDLRRCEDHLRWRHLSEQGN
ncbi:MAG TPA: hypothetical protein VIL63_01040, partial [Terriglobales bacterium]